MIIAGDHSIIKITGASYDVDQKKFPKETKIEKQTSIEPFIHWGDDNLLPDRINKEIGKDEVIFRSNEFNKSTHLGSGLNYLLEKRSAKGFEYDFSSIPEVDDWIAANNAQRLFLEFVEDYETLGNIMPAMILSKDRSQVAMMLRKQAAWSRWEKQNPSSRKVENLHYNSDWESYYKDDTIIIPALDVNFAKEDLEARTSGFEFIYRMKPIASKRFYYDMANVEVLMNSGNLEMRDMVKAFHKSRLKNGLGATFAIEVTEKYLLTRLAKENQTKWDTDVNLRRTTLQEVKTEVDKFLMGPDNQGKTMITTLFKEQMKSGYEYVPGVVIKKIDTTMEVAGWLPTLQQIQAQSFIAMAVDPSNIGISNQKDGMNSVSEKKNAFYNQVATLHIDRVTTLSPFAFAARFNGWDKKYPGFKWFVQDAEEIPHGNTEKPKPSKTE